jgi:hypothetical protein
VAPPHFTQAPNAILFPKIGGGNALANVVVSQSATPSSTYQASDLLKP